MNGSRICRRWKLIVTLLFLPVILTPVTAFSEPQFGLGISFGDDDAKLISCVAKINPSFKLEGGMGIESWDVENSNSTDVDQKSFFIGGYGIMDLYEKTQIYYGGKLYYIQYDRSGYDADGYGIAPTFGFEYFFTKHLSFGGEAEFYYGFYDGNPDDIKGHGTDSRVILRLYF